MKTKVLLIIIIGFLAVVPISVFASGEALELECSDTVAKGSELKCNVIAKGDAGIRTVSFKAAVSGNITYKMEKDSSWEGGRIDDEAFVATTSEAKASGSKVGVITITPTDDAVASSDNTLTLTEIVFSVPSSAEEGQLDDIEVSNVAKQITITNSDGSGGSDGSDGTETTESGGSSNPQTTDMNVVVIFGILVATIILVILGKKKLRKITH